MIAKQLRKRRLLPVSTGRMVAMPIDHGFTMGPLVGIESSRRVAQWLPNADIDAVIVHKGMLERLVERDALGNHGVLLHINGMPLSAPDADSKRPVASVDHAAQMGVDGISLQLNFTGDNDRANWEQLGGVTDRASELGLPTLLMLYDKALCTDEGEAIDRQRTLLRGAAELGVDIVKVGMPTSMEYVPRLLADIREDLPVIFAGGDMTDQRSFLNRIRAVMKAGAAGVCVGRNVFERRDPVAWSTVLSRIVHDQDEATGEVVHAGF